MAKSAATDLAAAAEEINSPAAHPAAAEISKIMAAPQSSSRAVAVFLILFMLVGLGAIGFGGWNLLRSFQCVHWPTANGVIESAETKSSSDNEGHTTYAPALQYRYLVARVTYEGSRLAFGTMSASPAYAQGILARYPVGKTVTVYLSLIHI